MKKIKDYFLFSIKNLSVIIISVICMVVVTGCSVARTSNLDADILSSPDEAEIRKRARIRLELASNYFESGQAQVALDETKQALATDPSYADAYNLLGLIYMQLSELNKAEESFRRALSIKLLDPNVMHNYAWLLCVQGKYSEADRYFISVLSSKGYSSTGKTLMARGLCQLSAKDYDSAEKTLLQSYEIDTLNPIVSYNLAFLFFRRSDFSRAQFYIRRLNNSGMSNSETLWLGLKVERSLGDNIAMKQLAEQLRKRFPNSREFALYESEKFDE